MSCLLPLLLFGAVALPAHAAVYKCAGDKGRVVYQDTACAPGSELGDVVTEPALQALPGAPRAKGTSATAAKPERAPLGTASPHGGNATQRKFLQVGMSEAEVLQKVGHPDLEDKGSGKTGPRWTYLPTSGDPATRTTLTFAAGKVATVAREAVR